MTDNEIKIINKINKIMNEIEGDYDRMSEYGQEQIEKYWAYIAKLTGE